MNEVYHKIQTVYLRDPDNKYRTLLDGQFAKPEFGYLKDASWMFTEKVDGTNIRVHWDGENVSFHGKTNNAQIPPHLLAELTKTFTDDKMLEVFGDYGGLTLHGEGYGKKINKGHKYLPDSCSFILFDISAGGTWFDRTSIIVYANKLDIMIVPYRGSGSLVQAVNMCKTGFDSRLADIPAEGLVCRPSIELNNRFGYRIITKIKRKDFYA